MLDALWESAPTVGLGLLFFALMLNLAAEILLLRSDLRTYQGLSPKAQKQSVAAIARIPGLYLVALLWGLLLLGFLGSFDNLLDRKLSDQAELFNIYLGAGLLLLPLLLLLLISEDRLQPLFRRLVPRLSSFLGIREGRTTAQSSANRRIDHSLFLVILSSYLLLSGLLEGSVLASLLFAVFLITERTRFRMKQVAMLTTGEIP